MILDFADAETEKIFRGTFSRRLPQNLQPLMHRKLLMIDAATNVRDLLIPPGNKLEALKGDRKGQYSIRVNDKWRICFVWSQGASQVEIVDYH